MTSSTISDLRKALGDSQEQFAARVGLASKGNVSVIERDNRCSSKVALRIEALARELGLQIDAAMLNDDVAAARQGCECFHAPFPAPAGGATSAKSGGEGFNATSSGATPPSSPAPEAGALPPMVGNVQGGAPVPFGEECGASFETAGASTGSAARLPQDERIEEQAA